MDLARYSSVVPVYASSARLQNVSLLIFPWCAVAAFQNHLFQRQSLGAKLESTAVDSRCRTLVFAVVCHWPIRDVDSTEPDRVDELIQYACHSDRCAELAATEQTGTLWPAVYSTCSPNRAIRDHIEQEHRTAEWVSSMLVVRWMRATAVHSRTSFAGRLLRLQVPTSQAGDLTTPEVLRHCSIVLATGMPEPLPLTP